MLEVKKVIFQPDLSILTLLSVLRVKHSVLSAYLTLETRGERRTGRFDPQGNSSSPLSSSEVKGQNESAAASSDSSE